MNNKAMLVMGVIGAFLGEFWVVQGLGIAQILPALCVKECASGDELSMTSIIVGLAVLSLGLALVWRSLKRGLAPPNVQHRRNLG